MNKLSLLFASVLFNVIGYTQSIGIGTTTPTGILHTSSTGLAVLVDGYNLAGTANTATLAVRSARGTSSSPVAAQTGDRVGSILYSGQNSNIAGNFNNAAGIDVYADENFSGATGGSSMRFATTPLGSVSRLDRVFITNAGNMGIGTTPAASAQLDVSSTTKGFLPPRMDSAQRNAIVSPANGLIIFNTNTNSLQLKTSSGWVSLTTPATTAVFLPTIVIGTQQWMNKNLDVAFYKNGDPIPQVTDNVAWAGLTTGAWCFYNNDSTEGAKYGKLYNWYAANDPRGLAPAGWHIPSDAEWTTLETSLGDVSVAGGKMKEAGTLNWISPNTGGNNNSGFAGLPGGTRLSNGTFGNVGNQGIWWTSTENSAAFAWYRYLFYNQSIVSRSFSDKQGGFSIRCVRD